LEERVGRDRRAVNQELHGARQRLDRLKHPHRRIFRRRRDLADGDRAIGRDGDEVGEGAADVDAYPHRTTTPTRPDLHRCTASAPANPSVAITASVPTQSPSRTYSVVTSLVMSVLASAVRTSSAVASCTWPNGSTVPEMPEFAARAIPTRASMARITR